MKILIYQQRIKKRYSLEKLARKTNISKAALNNYETEKRKVNIFQLEDIAKALDCKITDLFSSYWK
ncbi:MAG: helix-turn-helix domain-containing protein [Intestinibacter bartlettii]|jgi:transcriptional regulator with XRE-family HTH domain|uniref:helix-turn-helix domain-containing protein n=1 Tax=Intestinibacter bartlettii TaxID=261299 RepID=UPI00204D974C|nr:helix-turn-helix transcriptional regulator [Intestinibacter bartlettii]DAJ54430.1 MAG TPA: Helix-turn-helix XRE-family like protein [Caudoviricetes sp.]DAZ78861.1 MAG TPA: Helix-turn-helix XRE-family like protein [Caudoviricetes sp.]